MSNHALPPFHLAIPVSDIKEAIAFYGDTLGCEMGRSDTHWADWNFYGHQLVTHEVVQMPSAAAQNPVDGVQVPVPHFGVVLTMDDWKQLSAKLQASNVTFVVEPQIRFEGQVGEQATLFFLDPFGNALEFKAFKDLNTLFAK
ncbi:glyoxalase [Alteromonadaceae bacterium M269]|nr:glyoxalase [Alteromonadaceae bacterium M269]